MATTGNMIQPKGIKGGGGSSVTITPAYQSGTKIADYSIDETSGAIYAPPGSSSKHRYTITATSWSNSTDTDGYYTYDVTLINQSFVVPTPVNVYLSSADDDTFATDTELTQYGYLNGVKLISSTLVRLYAKTKPTSTFYIYISSDGGTGTGDAVLEYVGANIIQKSDMVASQDASGYYYADNNDMYSEPYKSKLQAANIILVRLCISTSGSKQVLASNIIKDVNELTRMSYISSQGYICRSAYWGIGKALGSHIEMHESYYNSLDTTNSAMVEYYIVKSTGGSGGEVYSTEETVIGTWMGKTLYRKCYDLAISIPAGSQYIIQDTTYDQTKVIRLNGTLIYQNGEFVGCMPLPASMRTEVTAQHNIQVDGYGHIYITVGSTAFPILGVKVTIEYTKA